MAIFSSASVDPRGTAFFGTKERKHQKQGRPSHLFLVQNHLNLLGPYIGHGSGNAARDQFFNWVTENALTSISSNDDFFLNPSRPLSIC
jgi:hypothetical protein